MNNILRQFDWVPPTQINMYYWQGVKRKISKDLGRDIPMQFCLLDGFPPDQFTKSQLFILNVLLTAPRKIITVNWMKLHKHTVKEWAQRKTDVFIWENECGFTVEIRHVSTELGAN